MSLFAFFIATAARFFPFFLSFLQTFPKRSLYFTAPPFHIRQAPHPLLCPLRFSAHASPFLSSVSSRLLFLSDSSPSLNCSPVPPRSASPPCFFRVSIEVPALLPPPIPLSSRTLSALSRAPLPFSRSAHLFPRFSRTSAISPQLPFSCFLPLVPTPPDPAPRRVSAVLFSLSLTSCFPLSHTSPPCSLLKNFILSA